MTDTLTLPAAGPAPAAPAATPAAVAYDALAGAYDVLTRDYCYDRWLPLIEQLAIEHGLSGRRLLDIACGTGNSFLPLLARGYRTTACDISPRMVALARAKAPAVDVQVADMRALRRLGSFDLITCLDDAVNYLLTVEELEGFLAGVSRNLAPGGVAVFDLNTIKAYLERFTGDWLLDAEDSFIAWSGQATGESGGLAHASIRVFSRQGASWVRTDSHHEQRHWPRAAIERAAARGGLAIVAACGQRQGALLDARLDELRHDKALYFATRNERG